MEEFIKYFYNITVNKINNKSDRYILESNLKKYQLLDYKKDPNLLYKNYILFKNSKMCCHDIILNKDGNILSEYDGKKYLLLKENISSKRQILFSDIINSFLVYDNNLFTNIKEKWEIKNDYYENIIKKISKENIVINESFDYYLGLSELSISLLNFVNFNNINYYIQHNRINYKDTLEKFYNPVYMVVDSRIRDFALFIKSNFFNDIELSNIEYTIDKSNFNTDEMILLIARLLYPDYYYDILDNIIYNNINNEQLLNCIKKSSSYEEFVKKIYKHLYKYYNLPKIEFLIS